MIRLNRKFVFHIPLYRYCPDRLDLIEMDDILDELLDELSANGFDSLYISKIESHYRTRKFEEMLITIFADDDLPCEIFASWFRRHNDVLGQESFAYETGNTMVINDLD